MQIANFGRSPTAFRCNLACRANHIAELSKDSSKDSSATSQTLQSSQLVYSEQTDMSRNTSSMVRPLEGEFDLSVRGSAPRVVSVIKPGGALACQSSDAYWQLAAPAQSKSTLNPWVPATAGQSESAAYSAPCCCISEPPHN